MARKRDRAFALFGAILFLLTSVGLSVGVIWQMSQDSNSNNNNTTTKQEGNMLAGTKLQGFTPIAAVSELKTEDLTPGTGKEVKASDTVTVDYTGAVAATGVIFQSSKDSGQPVSFPLDGVIAGWTEGMPGMKEGGTRRLLIPAEKAYGANPPQGSGIPANAALVFDVTLHSVGQ
jgi:FKBP-type peptidyl-prolyl cis-trans isomerase